MSNWKKLSLYSMAALYIAAGINHFLNPIFYKVIMPHWLPYHYPLIYSSGVAEIVLGILLIPLPTRRWTAWCIIILLIAVFPANIQMLLNYQQEENPNIWIAVLRLPLQLVLIAWAYSFAKKEKQ